MNNNSFELIGYVAFIDCFRNKIGKEMTKLIINCKNKCGKTESYTILIFRKIIDLKKNDRIHVKGKLSIFKYEYKFKQFEKIQLVGTEYSKIVWDSEINNYILMI